jgi:hypothetical protein
MHWRRKIETEGGTFAKGNHQEKSLILQEQISLTVPPPRTHLIQERKARFR